jgi:hypothetical protein
LQRDFPLFGGRPITWSPEDLKAAQGYERTSRSVFNDIYRWEGVSRFADDPESMASSACSFETMTECVKAPRLENYGHFRQMEIQPAQLSGDL